MSGALTSAAPPAMIQRQASSAALLLAVVTAAAAVTGCWAVGGGAVGSSPAASAHADLFIISLRVTFVTTYSASGPAAAAVQRASAARQLSNAVATKVWGDTGKIVTYYGASLPGFVAGPLSPVEVTALKRDSRVLGAFPNRLLTLETPPAVTQVSTTGFLGLDSPGGAWSQLGGVGNAGEGMVIGIIGTGIWPEAPSFSDRADPSTNTGEIVYGPAPSSFKGSCNLETGCNRKLIGCQSFWQGSGSDPTQTFPEETLTCRFPYSESLETHNAATAAGNAGVTFNGSASTVSISGVAPRARISVYKVFWGTTLYSSTAVVDFISAVDAAVADGCDVILTNFPQTMLAGRVFAANPIQMALKNAAAAGVSVVSFAGNWGPDRGSVNIFGGSVGPWQLTVAASNDNRKAVANLTLGDGTVYPGYAVGAFTGTYTPLPTTPLVMGLNVGLASAGRESRVCRSGTLDPAKVAGKIVLCWKGGVQDNQKAAEVLAAGGVAMILDTFPGSEQYAFDSIMASSLPIPVLYVPGQNVWDPLETYASTDNATAAFSPYLFSNDEIAPRVMDYSSRGPILGEPNLLKPDIAAPGISIVGPSSPKLPLLLVPGTQSAAAHMAGIAALVKQAHPSWSPMMIKSAVMTTAYLATKSGPNPGTQLPDTTPFSVGSGFVDPTAALNPGLVFDSNDADMSRFLCGVESGAMAS